jgi:hypothetical protein
MPKTAKIQISILTSARHFSLFQNIHAGSAAHTASYSMDTSYSLLPSGEVKDRWSYTSVPPICLQCIDRNLSMSTFYLQKVRKGKAVPLQAWTGPEGSRRLRLPDFKRTDTSRW